MAITSTGLNAALYTDTDTTNSVEDKTALGKDDFMTLLLVQLQYQDPTEPMDSETILTQTSQLASLESASNTNTALENLATTLSQTQDFSTVSAIGKTADLGSNAIAYDAGSTSSFEVYFPEDIQSGTIEILDSDGNIVGTIPMEDEDGNVLGTEGTDVASSGVQQFDWSGVLSSGEQADSGVYYVTASYKNSAGDSLNTRMGTYPIESVRFDSGNTLVKVGSSYVNLADIQEIY